MARTATGTIIPHPGRDGRTYRSLRFTAYGKRRYVSLGPVSASAAEQELRHVMADVERGTWKPPNAVEAPPEAEPARTFHEYVVQWGLLRRGQLAKSTREDYAWRLKHLFPAFGALRLDEISYDTVERYIAAGLAEGKLGPRSINMTVSLLAQILETAVERELIAKTPRRAKDGA